MPPGAGSRRSGALLAGGAGAVVAVVAAVLVAFVVIGRNDSGTSDKQAATTPRESRVEVVEPATAASGEHGLPIRPHVRLVHPGGATVDVPGGEVLYSDYLDLRRVAVSDLGRAWEGNGTAWRFISGGGGPPEGAITVDIPAASADDGSKVVALTAIGSWMEVPAERVGAVFRVQVTNAPAPWTLAVAKPRATQGDVPKAAASEAESLYWSDRAAWEKQETAWLSTQDLTVAAIDGSLLASARPAAAPARSWLDVQKDLDVAIRTLSGARTVQQAGAFVLPVQSAQTVAANQYKAGIARLAKLRKEWLNYRYIWAKEAGHEGDLSYMLYDDDQTVEQALESALALYAPWGVELTDYLARSGNLEGIDLRVLAPYGQINFTDVKIPKGALSFVEDALKRVEAGPGERIEERYLRLYSTNAIETTSWLDSLKDWKTETFLRYLPVALWAFGITTGGPFLLALTAADQILNWYQSSYETASDPYIYSNIQWAGSGLGGVGLFVDATEDLLNTSFVGDIGIKGQKLGAAQFALSAAVSYAVATSDWYLLKDVRAITEGTQAYCLQGKCNSWYAQNVPPIQVFASARVPAPGPSGEYPATRLRLMGWSMEFPRDVVGPQDLPQALHRPGRLERDEREQLGAVGGRRPGKGAGGAGLEAVRRGELARQGRFERAGGAGDPGRHSSELPRGRRKGLRRRAWLAPGRLRDVAAPRDERG